MTPFEVISLGDISISLARGHYPFATTAGWGFMFKAPLERRPQYVDHDRLSGLPIRFRLSREIVEFRRIATIPSPTAWEMRFSTGPTFALFCSFYSTQPCWRSQCEEKSDQWFSSQAPVPRARARRRYPGIQRRKILLALRWPWSAVCSHRISRRKRLPPRTPNTRSRMRNQEPATRANRPAQPAIRRNLQPQAPIDSTHPTRSWAVRLAIK